MNLSELRIYLTAFILLILVNGSATGQQIKGDKFVFNLNTPSLERKEACKKGCYVLTENELIKALQNAGYVAINKNARRTTGK